MSEILAVQNQKAGDRVHSAYIQFFKERYGTEPIFDDLEDFSVFSWLARKVGEQKAHDLVQMYIIMDGDNGWFIKNGHSLQILRKNINVVSAQLGLRSRNKFHSKHSNIWFIAHCDKCLEQGMIICKPSQVTGWDHYCNECQKKGAIPKQHTEEFITREEWIRRVETNTNKHKVSKDDFAAFKSRY